MAIFVITISALVVALCLLVALKWGDKVEKFVPLAVGRAFCAVKAVAGSIFSLTSAFLSYQVDPGWPRPLYVLRAVGSCVYCLLLFACFYLHYRKKLNLATSYKKVDLST